MTYNVPEIRDTGEHLALSRGTGIEHIAFCSECGVTYWLIDIANNGTSYDQEGSTLKGGQDSEDEEGRKVGC